MVDTRILLVAVIVVLLSFTIHSMRDKYTPRSIIPFDASPFTARSLASYLPSRLSSSVPSAFTCKSHSYRTEIISTEPLVIYFHDFLASSEIPLLLDIAEPLFDESLLTNSDGTVRASRRRTSRTAVLPITNAVVDCVLGRAREIMGSMLDVPHDDIQPPQLARYTTGQHFAIHADWFDVPQARRADSTGKGSSWNREASFFATLEDDCTGGETWFPHLKPPRQIDTSPSSATSQSRIWRLHQDGGLAFRPVKGGSLFWVNLFANGTGDERTRHSGLPVQSGVKTGMNIWPRIYYS